MMYKIDKKGVELIKSFEGCKLKAYKCLSSETYYTIGYGHYGADVQRDMCITQERAEEMLIEDISKFENTVNKLVKVNLTQSMFNALVSFCYNVGQGNFKSSTLLRKLNKGDYVGASEEFARWNKSCGKILKGLVKRRAKEKAEFLRMGIPTKHEEKETKKDIPSLKGYKGFSIVDGLKSFGYEYSFSYRKILWSRIGKTSKYKGTATQNLTLLNTLKSK